MTSFDGFRRFNNDDYMGYNGAVSFANGDSPLIAEIDNLVAIIDGNGLGFVKIHENGDATILVQDTDSHNAEIYNREFNEGDDLGYLWDSLVDTYNLYSLVDESA